MVNTIRADRGAQAAKPGPNGERIDYTVKGESGLRLRVTGRPDGSSSKIWSLLYTRKSDNKKSRITLGEYPAMGLAEARDVAGRYRNQVREGHDPAQLRREEKKATTFGELAEDWLTRHAKEKKRSWREDARTLNHDILPVIGAMKLDKIKTADIVKVIDLVSDRGADVQANRVFVLMRTIYRWGYKRGTIEANPAERVEKPSGELQRGRFLSPKEVRKFWFGLDEIKRSPQMQIIFRLSFLLGQRLNELALARKSEFDLAAKRWEMPGRRQMPHDRKESGAKNKRDHPLPLSDTAVSLLRRAFGLSGNSEWLFPGSVNEGPIGSTAAPRAWGRIRTKRSRGFCGAKPTQKPGWTERGGWALWIFQVWPAPGQADLAAVTRPQRC